MAIGTSKVQLLKRESTALGGSDALNTPYGQPIDALLDAIETCGAYINDASNRDSNVYVDRSGNDLRFRDVNNTTPITLSSLVSAVTNLDWKASVRAATTANITLSGAQTIDTVSIIAGDRVLVKNQSTGSQNGIYVCAAGAWSRSIDANAAANLNAGMAVFAIEGAVNIGTGWFLSTADPIVVGTTALTYTRFAPSNLVQTAFVEISANTTTTSTSFVDLLTVSVTTRAGSVLIIQADVSCSNNTLLGDSNYFRITVDGVAVRGAGCRLAGSNQVDGAAIGNRQTGLAAGSHTIKVQWRVTGSTGQIQPVTNPDFHHASLLVTESLT